MAKKKTLLYTIHLRDKALVDAINAQLTSPTGGPLVGDRLNYSFTGINQYLIWRAPYNAGPPEGGAAVEYAINAGAYPPALPLVEVGGAPPIGGAGYITSEWFTTSNSFPRNVATFTISSGWWIFGSSTKFYWGAEVVYDPPNTPTTTGPEPTEPCEIPVRRGLMGGDPASGFELTLGTTGAAPLSGSLSGDSMIRTRQASRKIDGFGAAHCVLNAVTRSIGFQYSTFPTTEWTRFYLYIPEAPSVTTQIWQTVQVAVSGVGFAAAVSAALDLVLFTCAPAQSLIGSFASLAAGRWYKLDFASYLDGPGDTYYLDVYVNGVKKASVTRALGGLVGNRVISNTIIGKQNGADLLTTARFRFDSWVISALPKTRDRSVPAWNIATPYVVGDFVHVGTDPATWNTYRCLQNNTGNAPGPGSIAFWRKLTDPYDWLHGSHLQWIKPKGFGATHGAWTGDWRVLAKPQLFGGSIATQITSSVSGALAAVLMDTEIADGVDGALGWVAMQGAWVVSAGGVPDGQFGYKIGGAASVLGTVVQGAGLEGHTALYSPSGLTAPLALGTAIELHHTKAADATAANMAMCQGVMELVGIFGEEDLSEAEQTVPLPHVPQPVIDRHNVQIPRSPWATQPNAMGPVLVITGTYVGNGTGQDIAFKVPPAFFYVRPLSGDTGGVMWWASNLDGHVNKDHGTYLFGVSGVRQDFSFVPGSPTDDQQMRWLMMLSGGSTQCNANGVTYAYVAFCDPAKRFCMAHADHVQAQAAALPRAFNLPVSTWQAEWLWAMKELIGSATANEIYTRFGAAHGTDSIRNIGGNTLVANAIETNVGNLTVKAGFVTADFDNLAFIGFRRHDGNNDPNEHKLMFMGSYTGDGTASRTVSLAPSTGLRPMWAIVVPDNAASINRDPSNTTNTSNVDAGGTTTTGITGGGIDSFSVGSTLNANGIQYTYFGFWGSATAGNGGWSTPTENTPVITEPPVLPDILDEPVEVPGGGGGGGVIIVNEPDLEDDTAILDDTISVGGTVGGQTCEFYTRELMNIALQHVGISKIITSLTTEQSEAAAQARRFVRKDVNAVLRDYPWDFATAYQNLVLQSGTLAAPVNNDWTFAYYAPNAMMFGRRIAKVEKGRKFDGDPVPFREGLLAGRPVIFCNVEATSAVPLVLEYTVRQTCPAFYGDALFREALTWKFAASFAMTLARDKDKQDYCLRVYNALLPKAKVVDANEQQQEHPGDADWITGRN